MEYPLERRTCEVFLEDKDSSAIERHIEDMQDILGRACPERKEKRSHCRNCSYEDFCWVEEESKEAI